MNDEIDVPQVRVIDAKGENHGVISLENALEIADEAGLDLVEVSLQVSPPVCKVLDYGKYKYEQQKKANEARKKQKTIDVKEIKMRPSIDEHDYQVKMKNVRKFLNHGDKVKMTIRFRGREMAHQDLGLRVSNREIEHRVEMDSGFRNAEGNFDVEAFRDFVNYEYGGEHAFLLAQRPGELALKMRRLLLSQPHVSEGETTQANAIYELIPAHGLPGGALALGRLARGEGGSEKGERRR